MTTIITILGRPIAKKRPRFARKGKFVTTYNDQETEESRFLFEVKHQVKQPIEGPLFVKLIFYVQRPKNHFGSGKNADVLKPSSPKYPTSKPDLDNYIKFALDCLNGVAWVDDSQITEIKAEKRFEDWTTQRPRTDIFIESLSTQW